MTLLSCSAPRVPRRLELDDHASRLVDWLTSCFAAGHAISRERPQAIPRRGQSDHSFPQPPMGFNSCSHLTLVGAEVVKCGFSLVLESR